MIGFGVSGGLGFSIAPYAESFDDIAGFSVAMGGSLGIFGGAVGLEGAYNPKANTSADKLRSMVINVSVEASMTGGTQAEVHNYATLTEKLWKVKLSDDCENETSNQMMKLINEENYTELFNKLSVLVEENVCKNDVNGN